MTAALSDFIAGHAPASGAPLHLVHCTSVRSSIKALSELALKPTRCDVYDTELLYMFYGRPAYKPGQGLPPSGLLEMAPVCFVIDPAQLSASIRMLPFDSGGFKRYRDLLGPGPELAEYELAVDPSSPPRLVHAFFETNANYYEQKPTVMADTLPISKLGARAYARLIRDPSLRPDDDRCGTVELQFDAPINLPDALRAIVAPTSFFEDPAVMDLLAKCPGAAPLPYKTYGRTESSGLAHALYERVETFLAASGAFG